MLRGFKLFSFVLTAFYMKLVNVMNTHWKELLPVDRYSVRANGILHAYDLKVLTMLYQPLIGANAYSLYMTLWSELSTDGVAAGESTHHSLMNATQLRLNDIYRERKKLEGIGLLKSYRKNSDNARSFLYEIQPPLSPETFFNDDVLSVYLYSRLGKYRYLAIKHRFVAPEKHIQDHETVTASFNEVFTSLHQSEIMTSKNSEMNEAMQNGNNDEYIQRNETHGLTFDQYGFDFELLFNDLKSFILPKEVITDELREAIARLSFVYLIDPLEMSSIIQKAYFKDEELTIEKLRKEVQAWYRFEFPENIPALSERTQPAGFRTMQNKEPQSQDEALIKAFEAASPRQLLEYHSEDGTAAAVDLKLVESIMFEQKLHPGVMNIIIDYVLTTNDMKLAHPHVEKIASHWKRKKIKTVKDAMDMAKAEHQKYQEWNQTKAVNRSSSKRKMPSNVRRDKLPKWMVEKQQSKEVKTDESQIKTSIEKQKWLEDYLKDL
jgi:replication initiation and membrane attachment protein